MRLSPPHSRSDPPRCTTSHFRTPTELTIRCATLDGSFAFFWQAPLGWRLWRDLCHSGCVGADFSVPWRASFPLASVSHLGWQPPSQLALPKWHPLTCPHSLPLPLAPFFVSSLVSVPLKQLHEVRSSPSSGRHLFWLCCSQPTFE